MISLKKLCVHVLYDSFVSHERWSEFSEYGYIRPFIAEVEAANIPEEVKEYIRGVISPQNKNLIFERTFAACRSKAFFGWGNAFVGSYTSAIVVISQIRNRAEEWGIQEFFDRLDGLCFDMAKWFLISDNYHRCAEEYKINLGFANGYDVLREKHPECKKLFDENIHKVRAVVCWDRCAGKSLEYKRWIISRIF